jgi:hypothetical protein
MNGFLQLLLGETLRLLSLFAECAWIGLKAVAFSALGTMPGTSFATTPTRI